MPFQATMHHPLVQVPTSTIVPFGISVMISASVPGAFRKLTSAATVAGFAAARSTARIVAIAALVIRAFSEKAESEGDSHAGTNMIQASCWEEASMDGEAVFGGLACTRNRRG